MRKSVICEITIISNTQMLIIQPFCVQVAKCSVQEEKLLLYINFKLFNYFAVQDG